MLPADIKSTCPSDDGDKVRSPERLISPSKEVRYKFGTVSDHAGANESMFVSAKRSHGCENAAELDDLVSSNCD